MVASVLIQCVGNRLRRDDGAAPFVADRLRANGLGASVREYWGEGTELMRDWELAERVVVVDAACSRSAPGTVHRIDALTKSVPSDFFFYSTHRFGVAEAVELARSLGQLPSSLHLYAIEGACFDLGEGLSGPVESAAVRLTEELQTRVQHLFACD